LVLIVAAVGGFVALVSSQSDDLTVTRSTTISAKPEAIFAEINDFHRWGAWSPWAKLDPEMKVTYAGPESGTGASYAWVGNSEVGEGKMTITESHPSDHVRINLEFIKPFASNNATQFVLEPDGDKTKVTWSMTGKKNFMTKAFCLIMDMDKLIGSDFEKGLVQLQSVAEASK